MEAFHWKITLSQKKPVGIKIALTIPDLIEIKSFGILALMNIILKMSIFITKCFERLKFLKKIENETFF